MSDELKARLQNLTPAQRALLERRLLEKQMTDARRNAVTRRDVFSPVPLSYSQELLWLLSQFADRGVAYNAPAAFRLGGPIDAEVLERALQALAERHEILRTSYDLIDERPMQIIGTSADVRLSTIDLSGREPEERERELHRILQEESEHPFDLRTDPVMRSTLIKLAPDDHIFLHVLHHVATDGYSRAIIFRDLTALYDSIAEGQPSPLPQLAIQYADYALWHRRWLESGVLERQLEYWKDRLAGAPARLELPTDFSRPAVRSYHGDHRNLMIDPALREALRDLGREHDGTLFIALLAAFTTLLHRYSGQDDIVVGTPFAGRNRSEFEEMVGYFINPLALRVDLSGDPTFRTLLDRARETTIEAFKHADVPYGVVVNSTNPERDLSQTPVFQAMMVLHNPAWQTRRPKFEPRGVTAIEFVHQKEWAKFDVLVGMSERQNGLNTTWEYSTELFEHGTIERMTQHFRELIASAVADPERPLSRLSMLTRDERSKVLVDWPSEAPIETHDRPVKELFEEQATRTPDAPAVAFEGERLSYDALNRRANRLARRLQELGVGPNRLVGVFMEKSLDLVVTVLAVVKAGGAYVPIDPLYPQDRVAFMLADAAPAVVVTQEHLVDALPEGAAPLVADWDELAQQEDSDLATVAGADDLAYVIYTSGSTGMPKGAVITNRSLTSAYHSYEHAYGLRNVSSHLQMASFSFDVFTGDFIRALLSGGKLVLCPLTILMDPERLYALMIEEQIDCAEFVPAVANLLFDYAAGTGRDLGFMRVIVVSSEAWRNERYTFFKSLVGPETRLINSYGLTEATIDSTYFEAEDESALVPDRFVPIGRPLPNTQVYILDSNLQPVPIGLPGELCVGGVAVARGYLNRPELTAERFVPDPFQNTDCGGLLYRTGDLVRWLPDGNIEFIGRTDRQVKIRGFRIEPGEVEAALERHPAVDSAAVVVREDRPGEGRLVAYVIPSDGGSVVPKDLRPMLAERLPAYMVPAAFMAVTEFPLTPNGKIDRDRLPEPPAHDAELSTDFVEPRSGTERVVADIWCDVLSLESVGADENFFELGGHSLLATRVLARMRQRFEIELTLRTIFEFPTVAGLAMAVDDAGARDGAGDVPALRPVDRSRHRVGASAGARSPAEVVSALRARP